MVGQAHQSVALEMQADEVGKPIEHLIQPLYACTEKRAHHDVRLEESMGVDAQHVAALPTDGIALRVEKYRHRVAIRLQLAAAMADLVALGLHI